MSLSSAYIGIHERLQDLAGDLAEPDIHTRVPASPAWSVKDTYAHLTGAIGDVLAGRTDGIGSATWTAGHVTERADRTLGEICEEWASAAPRFVDLLDSTGDRWERVVAGSWTHEQDIRGAVGLRGVAGGEAVAVVLRMVDEAAERLEAAGLAALRIQAGSRTWTLGSGEVVATLRVGDYELARLIYSRRSEAQMLELDWQGDPTPYLPVLPVYGPPRRDVVD